MAGRRSRHGTRCEAPSWRARTRSALESPIQNKAEKGPLRRRRPRRQRRFPGPPRPGLIIVIRVMWPRRSIGDRRDANPDVAPCCLPRLHVSCAPRSHRGPALTSSPLMQRPCHRPEVALGLDFRRFVHGSLSSGCASFAHWVSSAAQSRRLDTQGLGRPSMGPGPSLL